MLNKVVICGIDTSELEVIPAAEMKELMLKIKAGDEVARERFIRGNLKLVLSVLRRFSGRGEDPDDLFQVGCIGLMKSIDHFNTELGVRFSTYAVPMNVIWGNPPKNTIWTARPEKKEKIYAILQH